MACAPPPLGEASAASDDRAAAGPAGPACPAERSFPGSLTMGGPDAPASLAGLLASFDGVTGSIWLDDWPDYDLTALSSIRCIDGRLDVHNSPFLRSLRGLDHLASTTTIQLSNLPEVTSLEGLGSLEEVEALLIYDYDGHSGFESLDGLDRLRSLQKLSVSGPPDLSQVDALFRIKDATDLSFFDLPGLTDLSGLGQLESLEGSLYIGRDDALQSLAGFDALEGVGDDVTVRDNPLLPQADAEAWAAAIDEVGGEVIVAGNGS